MIFLTLIIAVVAIELGLILTVRSLRKEFQWLITEADEEPVLDHQALRKFVDSSFDAHLGWVRRPNTVGVEKGKNGDIAFHIDANGARIGAGAGAGDVQTMAAFGDSYVFCRQVEDGETWESELSRRLGIGVMNFGVGNYGADQALLRYQETVLPTSVKFVVLGFVPETICRIQSVWKHYLEFGNTFAFKPRFFLSAEGELISSKNPMRSADDFADLPTKLPEIQRADGAYLRKFRSLQFRFPYLLSFFRHPVRHAQIIGMLLVRRLARLIGLNSTKLEAMPFTKIMADNIRYAHRMYCEAEVCELLRAILLQFKQDANERGHVPLILVIPQLLDLRVGESSTAPYQAFFEELADFMPVIDMTQVIRNENLSELYIDDKYGGHLSARGNIVVAEQLAAWLQQTMAPSISKAT